MSILSKRGFTYKNEEPEVFDPAVIGLGTQKLSQVSQSNGVKCTWTSSARYQEQTLSIIFKWDFYVSKMKRKRVQKWEGHILLTSPTRSEHKFIIKSTKDSFSVPKVLHIKSIEPISFNFEYSLVPYDTVIEEEEEELDMNIFLPSNKTDVILVVDGKKIHVNKGFLSYHSEFFRILFSASFKEGKMEEIPIEAVEFSDFLLLLSTIYPKATFPNDNTIWNILELAERFFMAGVIRQIEDHFINISRYSEEEMVAVRGMCMLPDFMDEGRKENLLTQDKGICFEDLFSASDLTDAVLIVKDGQIHVNKGFLSFHSDYFADLFSSSEANEYEIKNVSYKDLASLFGTIHSIPISPTDQNYTQLLRLSRRYSMPGVVHRVENYLLYYSDIDAEKLFVIALKYKMSRLLKHSTKELISMKDVQKFSDYEKMSMQTKIKFFDRFSNLI